MAYQRQITADLLDYCSTKRQAEFVQAWLDTGSCRSAARKLQVDHAVISRTVTRIERTKNLGKYMPGQKARQKQEQAPTEISPKAYQGALKQSRKRYSMYVITCAQNATPVFKEGLNALHKFCEHNEAQLLVIPLRYRNPTSQWTTVDEGHDWWAPELEPYCSGVM